MNTVEERDYYEKQRMEEARLQDRDFERELWAGMMGYFVEEGKSIDAAANLADDVLNKYKERFQ